MQFSISKVAYRSIETLDVSVQAHMSNGLPSMAIVGLADKVVAESKERVRAALSSLGLALPAKRIVVNLSPADLLKEGAHFDLLICYLKNVQNQQQMCVAVFWLLVNLPPAALGSHQTG